MSSVGVPAPSIQLYLTLFEADIVTCSLPACAGDVEKLAPLPGRTLIRLSLIKVILVCYNAPEIAW